MPLSYTDLANKYGKPAPAMGAGTVPNMPAPKPLSYGDLEKKYANYKAPVKPSLATPDVALTSFKGMGESGSTPTTSTETVTSDLKGAAKAVIGSETAFGNDIAAAIGGNTMAKTFDALPEADREFMTVLIKLNNKAKSEGNTDKSDHYFNLIKNYQSSGGEKITDIFPSLLKSNEQVLGDAAGVAMDVAAAGTGSFGEIMKGSDSALESGKLALKPGSKVASFIEKMGASNLTSAAPKVEEKGASLGGRLLKGVATGAPLGAGFGFAGGMQANQSPKDLAVSTATGAVAGAALGAGADAIFGKKSASLVDSVSPRLTPAIAEEAGGNTSKSLLSGKITINPSERTLKIANASEGIIDPTKTFSEQANQADKGISAEAERLKSDIESVDHPVPKKDIKSNLRNIERPVLIASDTTLNNAYSKVLTKASDIIDKADGTVSGMLDARKDFDNFVKKQFPNLYESEQMTPMRTAIKDIRNEWNDFIASNLPDDVKYKASLEKQSLLYDAKETLSDKAARGAPKVKGEIGTTRFSRMSSKIPKLVKGGIVGGAVSGGIIEGAKKFTGF